ncbi:three-Cys-motif partner protein TcmP [Mesorhizobium japonicum]|uniref:three-Cys-motif partner protein TcmP n=1 Tax=Mesorhizobium japonicum TaxID=2066070 RepID=UPI003B5949F2
MRANSTFFNSKREMAVLKHVLLGNYLMPFCTMTTSAPAAPSVWYIDAYAGPGRYQHDDGSPGEDGSPSIALGIAARLATMERPRTLHCIFIEQKRIYVDSLTALSSAGTFLAAPEIIHGDAHDHFVAAVQKSGRDPLLAFVDPFGTALPYAILRDAFNARPANASTEILVNFHLGSIARIGALLESRHGVRGQNEKTLQRLDALLGMKWRELFRDYYRPGVEGSATEAAMIVAQAFRDEVLKNDGFKSLAIGVRKANDHYPRFQLTLFYRHPSAEYKFADAAHAANREWRRRVSEDEARHQADRYPDMLLPPDFDERQFADQLERDERDLDKNWTAEVRANILRELRGAPSLPISSNVRAIYGAALGLAGESNIRKAWQALAAVGLTSDYNKNVIRGVIARGPNWTPNAT